MNNKELVVTATTEMFGDGDPTAVDRWVSENYRQHSAMASDGPDALRQASMYIIPTPMNRLHSPLARGDRKIERLAESWWQPKQSSLLWLSSVLEFATPRAGALLQDGSTHLAEWFIIAVDGSVVVRTDAGLAVVSTVNVEAIVEGQGCARTTMEESASIWIGHRSVLPSVLANAPKLRGGGGLLRAG